MDIIVDWSLTWELLPSMISTIIILIIICGFIWIVFWFVPHNYLGCWEYPTPKTKSGIRKIREWFKKKNENK